jgi:fructose-bisphosphate aldolase class I
MTTHDLARLANDLVADGKGILAADESVATLTRRFEALGIESTPDSRRRYREMLFTTPVIGAFVSGVILYDETIRQKTSTGMSFGELVDRHEMVPGIKVDLGARPLAGAPGERVTEGLDGLRDRLADYRGLGARFAKWRAVIAVTDALPTHTCVSVNAHALGRYAALCQEAGLVPIVEPEVLMDGGHTIERTEEVTGVVLRAVFAELAAQHVALEAMLLKPNMVVAGASCPGQPAVSEVAAATVRCLRRFVPAAVPGIVFLSGGQNDRLATLHLDAINRLGGSRPWKLGFSYGRALQDAALATWAGQDGNTGRAQQALHHRARCNRAASLGAYTEDMERQAS